MSKRIENLRLLQLAAEGKLTERELLGEEDRFDVFLDLISNDPLASTEAKDRVAQEKIRFKSAKHRAQLYNITLDLNK